MTYELPNYFDTFCWIDPIFLKKEDKAVFKDSGRWLLNDCSNYYPLSFGVEVRDFEERWWEPKW